MVEEIKISVPRVPMSTNDRDALAKTIYGWKLIREDKRGWLEDVGWILKGNRTWRVSDKQPFKKARIQIEIFFETNRDRDKDNYPCKEVIDAIKNNKLIIDDSYKVIGTTKIDITGLDAISPRTEIVISPRK